MQHSVIHDACICGSDHKIVGHIAHGRAIGRRCLVERFPLRSRLQRRSCNSPDGCRIGIGLHDSHAGLEQIRERSNASGIALWNGHDGTHGCQGNLLGD